LTNIGSAKFVNLLVGILNFGSSPFSVIIINYVGRKTLMVVFGFLMAVGMYLLGVGMLIEIQFMQIAGIFIFIFSF